MVFLPRCLITLAYNKFNKLPFLKCSPALFRFKSTTSEEPKPFSKLPGPKGSFTNAIEYAYEGGKTKLFETQRKRFERYGPIYREKIQGEWMANIADAETIANVLRVDTIFPKRPGLEVIFKYLNEELGYRAGILGNDYDLWHAERSILSLKMLRPREVNKQLPGFNQVSKDLVARFREQHKNGVVENLEGELHNWAGESVSVLLIGQPLGFYKNPPDPRAVNFIQTTYNLNVSFGKVLFGLPFYKYFETPAYKELRRCLKEIFENHGSYLVKGALNAKEHDPETGDCQLQENESASLFRYFSDRQLSSDWFREIMISFLFGGIHTTSMSALWVIFLLANNPDAQEKLYQELRHVLGTKGEISGKTIGSLWYLKACVKESLRLRPTVPLILRELDCDIKALGYIIPAGTKITLNTYPLRMSEKHYGSNANVFFPDRWLRASRVENDVSRKSFDKFASLPFGYGVRMCLGRRVAEAEIYSLISQLVLNYRMDYVGKEEPKVISHLLLKPDKPVDVKFVPR